MNVLFKKYMYWCRRNSYILMGKLYGEVMGIYKLYINVCINGLWYD